MTTTQITPECLTEVLDGLFESENTTTQIDSPAKIDDPRVVATYNDADGGCQFAITLELSIANSLGASLTMIPAGGAEDATAAGEVPDNIGENLYEVLNICSAVFAGFHHERIVLDKVFVPGQALDADLAAKVDAAANLLQVNYELPRYQSGKVSLLKV